MRSLVTAAVLAAFVAGPASVPEARAAATVDTASGEAGGLSEIVVTAQKRSERLQDVPVPVSVLSGQELLDQHLNRVQDYYTTVPGLSLQHNGTGTEIVSIRGLTPVGGNGLNPAVGVVIDDMPFGATYGIANRTFVPDIDPGDLERIEVLRGPQGTLYGAASLAGLIKFVTLEPSTEGFGGRVQSEINGVSHGDGPGYGVHGSFNIPLTSDLAMRVSAFTRRDAGYIDDPIFNEKGINRQTTSGGRIAVLWRPSDEWSVKASTQLQNIRSDGSSYVDPNLPLYQQDRFAPIGAYNHDLRLYNLVVNGAFAGIHFTSLTGYNTDKFSSNTDNSASFGGLLVYATDAQGLPLYPAGAALELNQLALTKKWTQEFRLSGSIAKLDWLAGAFYTDEKSPTHDLYPAVVPTTLQFLPPLFLDDYYPSTYSEYAFFGDLTYHFTDRFDVQLGGRKAYNRQTYFEELSGPAITDVFFPGTTGPAINPTEHTHDNSFTYLFTPRLKLTQDAMLYARIASGYRPGGPNPTCVVFPTPCAFLPDTTRNYEVGTKSEFFDHILSIDASLYYIDWRNEQIQLLYPASGGVYFSNANQSKSQGLELSFKVKPVHDLTLSGWVAYDDARLKRDVTLNVNGVNQSGILGKAGDRLPGSPRISGNFAFDESLPITDTVKGFIAGSMSYTGSQIGGFPSYVGQPRDSSGGYAEANLRLGAHWEKWTVDVYGVNIADRRAILSFGAPIYIRPGDYVNYLQPRTIGLSVSREF